MKIAVNTRILQSPVTGIQNFILNLYTHLLSQYPQDDFIFMQTSNSKSLGKTAVIQLPDNNIFNLLFDLLFVHFLILKFRPDIFHGPSHLLPIFRVKNTKYVLTIHDLSFITLPHVMNRTWSSIYKLLTGISVRNADLVVTDSLSTREDVLKYFHADPAKVRIAYLGLSDQFFSITPKPSPHPRPYLLSVATHPLRKNIITALKAYAQSSRTNSDLDYLIAGPGSTDSRILEEVTKLNLSQKVFLKGVVGDNELLSLYQHASLFIYPSFYEGFGLPILEAMSQKVPVISSNTSSMPELMPDKHWLIDPYLETDIKQKIEELVGLSQHDLHLLIDKNFRWSKTFTWTKTAEAYSNLFTDLSK